MWGRVGLVQGPLACVQAGAGVRVKGLQVVVNAQLTH